MGLILKRQHMGVAILGLVFLAMVIPAQAQRRQRQPQVEEDPNPMLMSLTRQAPASFTAGALYEVIVTITAAGEDLLTAVGLYETIPPGWEYVSMRGITGDPPPVAPGGGESGVLQFAWINPPDLPYTFAYTLSVPSGESGMRIFSGQVEYRTLGGRLVSAPEITETNGVDNTPPVIELLGDNPLIVEVGSAFSEPGYRATDNVDGDVTASVQVQGAVDTSTTGTYRLSYTAVDQAGNRSQAVVRTVRVVAAGSQGSGGAARPRDVYAGPAGWTGGGTTRRDTPDEPGTAPQERSDTARETAETAETAQPDPDRGREAALAERIAGRGKGTAPDMPVDAPNGGEPGAIGSVVKRMAGNVADPDVLPETPTTGETAATTSPENALQDVSAVKETTALPDAEPETRARVARADTDAATAEAVEPAATEAAGGRWRSFSISGPQAATLIGVLAGGGILAALAALAWRFAYSGPTRRRVSPRQ